MSNIIWSAKYRPLLIYIVRRRLHTQLATPAILSSERLRLVRIETNLIEPMFYGLRGNRRFYYTPGNN